jgi:hypothetical protein
MPLSFTGLSSSGISFDGSLDNRDTGWQTELGAIKGRLIYSISASGFNFNASTFNVKINGTMGGFIETRLTKPPDDITKTLHLAIPEISTDTPSISVPVPDDWSAIKESLSSFSFGLW